MNEKEIRDELDRVITEDSQNIDKILGYHFDTFSYIEIDHHKAKQQFFDNQKDLMLLNIGECLEL